MDNFPNYSVIYRIKVSFFGNKSRVIKGTKWTLLIIFNTQRSGAGGVDKGSLH